jgi:hypothetical protein
MINRDYILGIIKEVRKHKQKERRIFSGYNNIPQNNAFVLGKLEEDLENLAFSEFCGERLESMFYSLMDLYSDEKTFEHIREERNLPYKTSQVIINIATKIKDTAKTGEELSLEYSFV